MTVKRRPGRRPGSADTRGEILSAARKVFAEKGFDKATVRGIAREAEVDPALVHHYFDTKEGMFAAAMRAAGHARSWSSRRCSRGRARRSASGWSG